MKKILVTGAAGFIGSHLCEQLVKEGHQIKAFDRYNIDGSYGWLQKSEIINEIEFILGDIRDYDSVYKASKGCYSVFHLAALIGIPYSYISPLAYLKTNIEGSYNILEAAKELNLDQIIITSTSETYGSAQYIPIDELHPLVGQSPYSATKIAADQLACSYISSFNQPIKIVRPFNTYGPRQSSRAVIPTIISQLVNNSNSLKLGNINPTRDLTYVSDTVNGFLEIFKNNFFLGQTTNIGSGEEISIKSLIDKLANLMNTKYNIEIEEQRIRPEKSEVTRLMCDNSKLINNSNWKLENSLDQGLKKTINWFLKNDLDINTQNYYV